MDKAKIIDALANASFYTISEAVFIQKLIAAGVESYLIDIVEYNLTFKGKETIAFDSMVPKNQTLLINLLRKDHQGTPLMVQALKKAGISKYEVFLPEKRMVFYKKCGKIVKFR